MTTRQAKAAQKISPPANNKGRRPIYLNGVWIYNPTLAELRAATGYRATR